MSNHHSHPADSHEIKLTKCLAGMCLVSQFKSKLFIKHTEIFEVKTGLKQGDTLSPILFNLAMEKVVRSLLISQGKETLANNTIFAYSDDIGIIK